MTLLELLAAIAVSTLLFIGLVDMINVSLEDARGQQAALQQSQMVEAAQKYIALNYAKLKSDTASGAIVGVTVADLKAGGFLSGSFTDTNSYQQNTCVLVLQDVSAGKLNALVTTYGGLPIPDRSIAAIAMGAGQGAGYIAASDAAIARGPSWSMNTVAYRSGTCQGGVKPLTGTEGDAGHLVSNIFYDGPGQLSTDFLYRDAVPGRPDLNRMNVPLQMASAALVNTGDACTQIALAIDSATKSVVVCDGTAWKSNGSSWKDPVANYTALASVSKTDGDVRVTRDTGRAFVYRGSTNTWTALAVDQNGDLEVPRDLTVDRDVDVDGSVDVNGGLHTKRHIYTDADINVAKNANISGTVNASGDVIVAKTLTARGDITAKGNMDIDGYLRGKDEVRGGWLAGNSVVIDGKSSAGSPCNQLMVDKNGKVTYKDPYGTIIADANGILLNCMTGNVFRYTNGTNSP